MAADPMSGDRAEIDVSAMADVAVLVAGGGTAGRSAAGYLADVGARVTVADTRFDDQSEVGADADIRDIGARAVGFAALLADDTWLDDTDLVIVSPGFAPSHALVIRANGAGIPVWGEVELAWRLDRAGVLGAPRTWLVITGTNGKTTTTAMAADIVAAGGRAVAACGNIGLPVLDAMRQEPRVDVLCAELSSFQLHWAPSLRPDVGVVLNVAADHLDWHGSFDSYAAAKAVALRGAVGVVGLDDAVAAGLPVSGRRIGFTLTEPADGELGVVDGAIVDRAFDGPRPIVDTAVIRPSGPPGLSDALAATALALAIGVPPDAVASALHGFRPAAHRGEVVARNDGIDFVDDSKATNPHAALAAILGHRRVVLIAGGLLKGAEVDELVRQTRTRLAAVVAIGRDRGVIVEAIARHAPEVPTVTVFPGDDGRVTVHPATITDHPTDPSDPQPGDPAVAVMNRAVAVAAELAHVATDRPDAVLLAPAAASLDMFAGYGRRGDAFAAAALALPGSTSPDGSR